MCFATFRNILRNESEHVTKIIRSGERQVFHEPFSERKSEGMPVI